ncbi:MAG TPA: thioredoxin domain-containing protein [Thermoanaerobaculia bacterium]
MANRLAGESSPYLLQHAHNPVDWHPWGEEAFARARREDKPVFLSIGYSTCHWCHVMERESFENEKLAARLNQGFVSIKVDREERPDVDDVYMTAVQILTGTGGWPLSLFLTPDGKPFYGGTYFPPEDRWGRPGFATVLDAIANAWKTRRAELEGSAGEILGHVTRSMAQPAAATPGREVIRHALTSLRGQFDPVHGGFGDAPKFPPAMRLDLLTRLAVKTGDAGARGMVETTLAKMSAGGLYDHVGGGFHRYSVDERWLVPHFEKMLYDNALLARTYLLAGRAFAEPAWTRVARETLDYLLREMTPPGRGGFYSAQDADSDGVEGSFYVWNPETLREAVGAPAAPIVAARFGVTETGNFEGGETVLSAVRTVAGLARDFSRTEPEIEAILEEARAKMRDVRSRRVAPATDDKLLTDWSALAISAFALGGRLLSEPRYERAARDAADRILETCRRGGLLLHRDKEGRADIPGFASDHAFLAEALLDLYEATFEPRYFSEAVAIQEQLDMRFAADDGGYYLSSEDHDHLPMRPRELFDGAVPSAASVSAMTLVRLAAFTGEARYRERLETLLASASGMLARAAAAFPRMLCALDRSLDPPVEVVLSGIPGREDFEALRRAVFESPNPDRVLAHAHASVAGPPELAELTQGRGGDGPAAAYVCEGFACQKPASDPAAVKDLLARR